MRKLSRPSVSLPTLCEIQDRYGDRWKSGPALGPTGDKWNEPDVRGALYAMHGRACAYCETELPENDRGDVEHFRPKSLYPWLAYDFSNYLLACGICNSNHKSNKFPLADGARPCQYDNRSRLGEEARQLLDPACDPTSDWLDYDFGNELCPAIPRSNLDPAIENKVRATIGFFHLNTRPLLVKCRLKAIDAVVDALQGAGADPARRRKLMRLASRFSPHASVTRPLISLEAPYAVPGPSEEVGLLIEAFCEELQTADAVFAITSDRRSIEIVDRFRKEVLWALAVLWFVPPAADATQVEAWLDREGVTPRVRPFRDQLANPDRAGTAVSDNNAPADGRP